MSPMSRSAADSASAAPLPSPKERRRLREARALSEAQVAEAVGVTRATVRSWETGRSDPRGRKLEAYVKLLGALDEAPDEGPGDGQQPGAEGPCHPSGGTDPSGTGTTPDAPARGRPAGPPPATTPAAGTRPRTATKRAAKPPRSPASAPVGLRGLQQPQERLKPVDAARQAGTTAVADAPPRPAGEPGIQDPEPGLTPEEAFDALYAHAAPGLVHQAYLLTGRRRLSRESVEHAFLLAWQRWPEVAVDRDPVGWVRAAAYEYALSPWHRLRRAHRHPDGLPAEPDRRALLGALLELPPPHRRTVLLYDGLGLDLPETAAETEASTPAAANRLLHARTVIGTHVPELAHPDDLHHRLGRLVADAPATATLAEPASVRTLGERRGRMWTRTAFGVTAALIAMTAFTVATAPTEYIPVNAPGQTVEGVPVRGGSPQLTPGDRQLQELLRKQPHHGPERLVPDSR